MAVPGSSLLFHSKYERRMGAEPERQAAADTPIPQFSSQTGREGRNRCWLGIFWGPAEFPDIAVGLLLHSSLMHRPDKQGGHITHAARSTSDPAQPELPLREHPRKVFLRAFLLLCPVTVNCIEMCIPIFKLPTRR